MAQQVAFATGVPSKIYAFYRYTRNSTCLYHTQVNRFLWRTEVKLRNYTIDLINRLRTLYTQ